MIDEMSEALREECGFNVEKGTLLLAESPTDLVKIMKMSLLSADEVHLLTDKELKNQPDRIRSFSESQQIYNPFLTNVYESESTIYTTDAEELNHNEDDIAIVGMGGSFAGRL